MSEYVDFSGSTMEDREQLLGREFRNVHVLGMQLDGSALVTRILINGMRVCLIGDPAEALAEYVRRIRTKEERVQ